MVEPITGQQLRGPKYMEAYTNHLPGLLKLISERYQRDGKITFIHLMEIAAITGLPLKTTTEFLEIARVLPSGTWERRKGPKLRAKWNKWKKEHGYG